MTDSNVTSPSTAGFTLLELLVAMGILTLGVTTLLGVMTVGVDSRRSAEMRARAVTLAGRILQDVQRGHLAEHPLPEEYRDPGELAIPRLVVEEVDGEPKLRYTVDFASAEERADLVLVTVRVAWLEQGAEQGVALQRLLPRQVPFAQRVAARREAQR